MNSLPPAFWALANHHWRELRPGESELCDEGILIPRKGQKRWGQNWTADISVWGLVGCGLVAILYANFSQRRMGRTLARPRPTTVLRGDAITAKKAVPPNRSNVKTSLEVSSVFTGQDSDNYVGCAIAPSLCMYIQQLCPHEFSVIARSRTYFKLTSQNLVFFFLDQASTGYLVFFSSTHAYPNS